jgi:hypothetical protein
MSNPPRARIAGLLHDLDPRWMEPWAGDGNAHMHRTLELAAALLDGAEPLYAEVQTGPGVVGDFALVVVSEDRVVRVSGTVDEGWPAGTVVPRHELRGLELRETPHRPFDFGEPGSDSVRVSLDFGAFTVTLPSVPNSQRGKAVAALLPSLLADRLARP